MMKSSTSTFGFSSSLVFFFFIVASIVVYSKAADVCEYALTVKTGNDTEAGTDSLVGVTIGNFVGESVRIPNLLKWSTGEPGHVYFQSGNQELFLGLAPCITPPVCTITVTADGRGQKPRWNLEYVTVYIDIPTSNLLSPQILTKFEFHQWIAVDLPPYELKASRDVCGLTRASSINDI